MGVCLHVIYLYFGSFRVSLSTFIPWVCVCVLMAGFNQMLCFSVLIVLYEND